MTKFVVYVCLYVLMQVCLIEATYRIRGNEPVGIHYVRHQNKGKYETVVFRQCHNQVPSVNASTYGASWFPDTFRVVVLGVYKWGFKTLVQRTDVKQQRWGQQFVRIKWTADFDSSGSPENPCLNGGSCRNTANGHVCRCVDNYGGEFCQISNSKCYFNPCQNGAACEEDLDASDFHCTCPDGFAGKTCSSMFLKGASVIVPERSEHGLLSAHVPFGKCLISAPSSIEIDLPAFLTGVLGVTVAGRFDWGFVLSVREISPSNKSWTDFPFTVSWRALFDGMDTIERNICQNNGKCLNVRGGIRCQCKEGYSGILCERGFCERNPCKNRGVCSASHGRGYVCRCPRGFAGRNCQIPVGESCKESPCQNGGKCRNGISARIECDCKEGYGGKYCSYRQLKGKYNVGSHYVLHAVDKYVDVPYKRCMHNRAVRVEMTVTGSNKYPDKFRGHATQIYDWGFRALIDRLFGYGWAQFDVIMEWTALFDEKGFDLAVCRNGGFCSNMVNGSTCACARGFAGEKCEKIDHCTSNPCVNGYCVLSEAGSYYCLCRENFVGRNCEIDFRQL